MVIMLLIEKNLSHIQCRYCYWWRRVCDRINRIYSHGGRVQTFKVKKPQLRHANMNLLT